jgi:hypothetical protein
MNVKPWYPTAILVTALALSLAACDVLDEKPRDFVSNENFFETPQQANAAAIALYQIPNFAAYFNVVVPRMTVYAPYGVFGRSDFEGFQYGPDTGNIAGVWDASYQGILRANQVLKRVPPIRMDEVTKNQYLGEAHFMRAYFYFNLVRFFGGVPITTDVATDRESTSRTPRSAPAEVYDLILEDLQFAEEHLPPTYPAAQHGRATSGAAKALLAKVYLTLGTEQATGVYPDRTYREDASTYLQRARDKAQEVMDSDVYRLMTNYRDVFDPATEGNDELIFVAKYLQQATSAWQPSIMGADGAVDCGLNQGRIRQDFYDGMPATYRREISAWDTLTVVDQPIYLSEAGGVVEPGYEFRTSSGVPETKKYIGWSMQAFCFGAENDYPILRYADVLLMFAEAENEVNGPTNAAYEAINAVRARARAEGVADQEVDISELPPLSGLSQEAFRDAVYRERRLELLNESHGWFDAVRTGRLVSGQPNGVERGNLTTLCTGDNLAACRYYLYPIPRRALDQNTALEQNPGWTGGG